MTEHTLEATTDLLFCEVHPDRESTLRCNKCGRVMCADCAVLTPVGYRCRECVREQQDVYFNAAGFDYVIAGGMAIVLGALGAIIMGLLSGMIGFFALWLSIIISPAIGALIGDLIHRAVGKRRGRYTWIVAAAGVILGALPLGLFSFGLGWLIYLVLAPGAAAGRLRIGGRIRLGR